MKAGMEAPLIMSARSYAGSGYGDPNTGLYTTKLVWKKFLELVEPLRGGKIV
jgi:hypothetical protein